MVQGKLLEPKVVFENSFFTVAMVRSDAVVLTRTTKPFTSKDDIDSGCWPVQLALDRIKRGGKRLLVDTRLAVGNNDPAFERNFAEHRQRMVIGFDRVALLVQTAVGKLQNERLAVSRGPHPSTAEMRAVPRSVAPPPPPAAPRVFMVPELAYAYLLADD